MFTRLPVATLVLPLFIGAPGGVADEPKTADEVFAIDNVLSLSIS